VQGARAALSAYGDVLFAGVLVALGLCELFVPSIRSDFHGPKWVNVLVIVAIAQFVAWRRRAPFAAFAIYVIAGSAWLDVSNAEIGRRLFISEATAKTHVASILRKTAAGDRVGAVVLAYESGLVRPGD
jgi:Bacterial regulatory proteins, luxR family